jgi:hypothetical protein
MSSSTNTDNNNNNNNTSAKKKKTGKKDKDPDLKAVKNQELRNIIKTLGAREGPRTHIGGYVAGVSGFTNFSRGTLTVTLENKANEFFTKGVNDDITKFHRLDADRLIIAVTCTLALESDMVARMMRTRLDLLNVAGGEADVEYDDANPKEIVVIMYFSAEKEYVGSDAWIDHVEREIHQGYLIRLYNTPAFWAGDWPVYEENLNGFGDTTSNGLPPNSYIMDYHYFQDTLTQRIFPLVAEAISQVLSTAFGPQMVDVTTRCMLEEENLLDENTWFNEEQGDGFIPDVWGDWLLFNGQLELDDPALFQAPEIEVGFLIHNVELERLTGGQQPALAKTYKLKF